MPTELALAARLGIGRGTVRAAYELLRQDGLIERRPGRGTTATASANRRMNNDLGDWSSFRAEQARHGNPVDLISASIGEVDTPAEVAAALAMPVKSRVILVERVLGCAGDPAVWFRSWLHPACRIDSAADARRPLYSLIRAAGGPAPASSHEQLFADGADTAMSRVLGLRRATPVLVRRRIVRDGGGHVLEFNLGIYRTDRCLLTLMTRLGGA